MSAQRAKDADCRMVCDPVDLSKMVHEAMQVHVPYLTIDQNMKI